MSSFPSASTNNTYRIALILWIGLIFFASGDAFSGEASSRILGPLLAYLFPSFSESEIHFWHIVLRKIGHITGYFVLGFLAMRAFAVPGQAARNVALRALLLVVGVAVADEIRQSFSMFRTGSIVDVGYDCLGGFTAVALLARQRYEPRFIFPYSIL